MIVQNLGQGNICFVTKPILHVSHMSKKLEITCFKLLDMGWLFMTHWIFVFWPGVISAKRRNGITRKTRDEKTSREITNPVQRKAEKQARKTQILNS